MSDSNDSRRELDEPTWEDTEVSHIAASALPAPPYLPSASESPEDPSAVPVLERESPETRTRPTAVAIAGIGVVVLVVALVVAVALHLTRTGEETRANGQPLLSSDFARGATQYWSIPSDLTYPITALAASSTELIILDYQKDSSFDGRMLTAYSIAGNSPTKIWSVKAPAVDFYWSTATFWGANIVYGSSVVDAKSGETVATPWPEDATVVAAPGFDHVVACSGTECIAYDQNFTKMWSAPFTGTDISEAIRSHGQYFAVQYSPHTENLDATILNLDTGAVTALERNLANPPAFGADASDT